LALSFDCCILMLSCFLFFFSSRRRHTRCYRDWSSDVCSSDLSWQTRTASSVVNRLLTGRSRSSRRSRSGGLEYPPRLSQVTSKRSEERRVGKEDRARWWKDE